MGNFGEGLAGMVKMNLRDQQLEGTLKAIFQHLDPNTILVLTTKTGTEYGLVKDTEHGHMVGRKADGKTTWHKLGVWSIVQGGSLKYGDGGITTRIVSWEQRPMKKKPPRKTIKVGTAALTENK